MPIDPLSMGIAAGVNVAAPMIAKGIGSLFGLDEASSEERNAAMRREAALERLRAQAEGRTPSAAQLAGIAQQQRTQQALASMAQQGSVQQRASNARAAMRAAPEAMAQQGASIASTRAAEMESARNALAQGELNVATQEATAGKANREYMQRLIGAGVQGAATAATMGLTPDEKPPGGGGGGGGASQPAAEGVFQERSQELQMGEQYKQPLLSFGPEASLELYDKGVVPSARSGNFQLDPNKRGSEYTDRRRGVSSYGSPSLGVPNLTLGGRYNG